MVGLRYFDEFSFDFLQLDNSEEKMNATFMRNVPYSSGWNEMSGDTSMKHIDTS